MSACKSDNNCQTLQLLQNTIAPAWDPALILDPTGAIVLASASATSLVQDRTTVYDVLRFETECSAVQELLGIKQAELIQADGTIVPTPLSVNAVGSCPCCSQSYFVIYICFRNGLALKQDVVDAAFDPMFEVDEKGTILLVNKAATDMFGYTKQEFLHNNISLICGGDHAAHHEEYMKRYLETKIKHVIGKQREVMARKKDGTEFPVELGLREINHGSHSFFCGFVKDLSLIKRHEAELEERENLLQSMINSSFDPMFEIDETGVIRMVNRAAVNLFGYSEEEFIGSNISMICGGGHAEHHDMYMQHYLITGERRIIGRKRQVQAKRKDGTEFDIELGVQEVKLNSGKRAFCGYVRDLTQQKLDKKELQRNKRLIAAKFFGEEE